MKEWYCVQVGDDGLFDRGSYRLLETRKMAAAAHKQYPSEEVRIVTVLDDGYGAVEIVNVEVIYEGEASMDANLRAGLWNLFFRRTS